MWIVIYNVEWFNNLFDNNDQFFCDGSWLGCFDVCKDEQIDVLVIVFQVLDVDVVMVIEVFDDN